MGSQRQPSFRGNAHKELLTAISQVSCFGALATQERCLGWCRKCLLTEKPDKFAPNVFRMRSNEQIASAASNHCASGGGDVSGWAQRDEAARALLFHAQLLVQRCSLHYKVCTVHDHARALFPSTPSNMLAPSTWRACSSPPAGHTTAVASSRLSLVSITTSSRNTMLMVSSESPAAPWPHFCRAQ